ncbi:MAG: hypothetical protein HFE58_03345 [Firmicutes bacterium]|nr:hypothetical protein [Bacillota bacterium]
MAKMGRPTTNPKDQAIKIRATKDDREKLLYCCEKLNKTQYEVIMEGLNWVYEKINKGVCFRPDNQANKLLAPK